jgi:hypothetical protein
MERSDRKDVVWSHDATSIEEQTMGFGRGLLLWLIGIPLPIIILIAILMHH